MFEKGGIRMLTNSQINDLRKGFISDFNADLNGVRETIAKSWYRSKLKNVSALRPVAKRDIGETFRGMRAVNNRPTLFEYIFSHAESIYQQNNCRDKAVIVTDAQANVCRIYGSKNELAALAEAGVSEESSLLEATAGTNALGTCLYTRKPVCVCRSEHYKDAFAPYVSYGAPILDERNEIAALIGVFARDEESTDPTWLSLIGQAAMSISKECLIYHQRHDLMDLQDNFDRLINTMNFGIVLLDSSARIVKANSIARYFFLMYEYELVGQHITNFISPQDIDFSLLNSDIYDQEICVHSGEVKKFTFLASVYLTSTWDAQKNYLLVFNKAPSKTELAAPEPHQTAKWHFNDIVGTSPLLMETLNLAKIASKTNCTVLITGESGVGKELIAQAIHNESCCANGPFVAVNCGAIPKGLAESELFGYENGAFTGAKRTGMPGKFELANGGTIFLDEIGEMSPDLQICLLRALQEQEVTRVGGKTPIKINVRVIAATNKNLETAINNGAFRMDLYYRLNVFSIHVPPLRERCNDIANLAHYFLQKYKLRSNQAFTGFTPEALNALQNYSWSGNVRELENTIERAVIICRSDRIRLDDLPDNIRACYQQTGIPDPEISPPAAEDAPMPLSTEEAEKEIILRALRSTQGNVSKAAGVIGISRRTLYRKIEKYNIAK